jgi:hypothetical protein
MAVGEVLIVKLKNLGFDASCRNLSVIFEVGVPLSKNWTKSVSCIRRFDSRVFKPDFASY